MAAMRRWILWGGACTATAAAVLWWSYTRADAPAPAVTAMQPAAEVAAPAVGKDQNVLRYGEGAPQLTMIQSRAIPASPVPLSDELSARVVYDEDVTARLGVGLAGRVVNIKAAPGQTVKAGQVLAEVDSPDAGTAYADLDKARADEARKRLVYERARELGAGDGIAAKEVEAAQADYAQAQAETARAQLRLHNINPRGLSVQGQRVSLVSPMAGVVVERSATQALEVSPGAGAPLFVVTDPRHLWLMIDLPERLLSRVRLGASVAVHSDAYPDEIFSAKVVQLGQVVDPNTRRVAVRARLDNLQGRLLPEMFVRVSLLQDSGSGVKVPNSAIVNRGIYEFVFVQTAPGQFERRQVQLLSRDSDACFVGRGLKGGEDVVTTGALLLDAELSARASEKS